MNKNSIASALRKSSALVLLLSLFTTGCQQSEPQSQAEKTLSGNSLDSGTVKRKEAVKAESAVQPQEIEDLDLENIQKAEVSRSDSSFWINGNINNDYRIFGYEQPDTASRKLITFSVFTADVEGNPYQCPLGSYYGTSGLEQSEIKYRGESGNFIMADFIKEGQPATRLYFDKNWIDFSE